MNWRSFNHKAMFIKYLDISLEGTVKEGLWVKERNLDLTN